jgi:GTP-binding protein
VTKDASVTEDDRAASPATGGPVVAIDGPAGSGKSTVAQRVATSLGVPHLDTGALYRAVTLACLRAGVDVTDADACEAVARRVEVDRRDGRTWLDGEDVEDEIRGPEVTAAVSAVSAHAGVRAAMTPIQRTTAARAGAVVEGRDIGTVVLPDADLKVFLTASVEERTRRRAAQLGLPDADADTLRAELERRDLLDGSREVAPLLKADDAWELDTTDMDLDEVVDLVVDVATSAWEARLAPLPPTPDPLTARQSLPRVAVVGRPNVGKSTLVNRIIGDRVTIVEERPGVTRDRTEHLTGWLERPFLVVDTGGWEHGAEGMAARIVAQAEAAIAGADVVLFTVDATVGALEDDERYARLLRRSDLPVLLVANKVDSDRQEPLVHELYSLGLGAPHPVSARHGRGVGDLLDEVLALLPDTPVAVPDETTVPHVALVGRPNVGKSSLFNRLLGEERSIVDAVPHTTRDAVDTMVEVDGEPWVFVDTAGMRRRYRHGEETELYSVDRTRRAIEMADITLFVVDASEPLGEQDQRLAALVRDAGRGVVLVLNKWDLVDDDRRYYLDRELDRLLGFASWAPRVNVSATSGRGVRRLVPHLKTVWDNYRRRVPTRELNRLVEEVTARVPPPTQGRKALRVKYVTQAETAPPRFVAFTNGRLPATYRRFLERQLREAYDFAGVPVAIDERPPRDRQRPARRP